MNIACSRWPGSRERMSERVSASQVRRFVGVGGRAPEIQARWWAICRRHRCNLRRNGRPLLALDDDEAESPLYAPRPANSSQLNSITQLSHSFIIPCPLILSFFTNWSTPFAAARPPLFKIEVCDFMPFIKRDVALPVAKYSTLPSANVIPREWIKVNSFRGVNSSQL